MLIHLDAPRAVGARGKAGLQIGYALLLLIAPCAEAALDGMRDSAALARRYTADDMLGGVDLWQNTGLLGAAASSPGSTDFFKNGSSRLEYTTDVAGGGVWMEQDTAGSYFLSNVDGNSSYTFEVSVKMSPPSSGTHGTYMWVENAANQGLVFTIRDTGDDLTGDTSDNTDGFHVYRLAFDAADDVFHVWRDGESLGTFGAGSPNGGQRLIVGDGSSSLVSGRVEYEIVSFDATGAYEPRIPLAISIQDATVTEGDGGTTNLLFAVSINEPPVDPISVDYTTVDDTATVADGDYLFTTGQVFFAAGETNQSISVTVYGDTTGEPDEDLFVALSNLSTGVLATAQAVGTILNDDPIAPSVVVGAATQISGTRAVLQGQVTAGFPAPDVELHWWKASGETNIVDLGQQGGSFSHRISGLDPQSSYGYQAVAANAGGAATSGVAFVTTTALRIVAFGDSTTAPRNVSQTGRPPGLSSQIANHSGGHAVSLVDETSGKLYVYSDVLLDELPARGVPCQVFNDGIGGSHSGFVTDNSRFNIAHGRDRFDSDVRSHNPDVVIIQLGINDSYVDSGTPVDPADANDGLSRIYLSDAGVTGESTYTGNITFFAQTLKAEGVRVILMTSNKMAGTLEAWRNARLLQYVNAMTSIAASEGVDLLHLWGLYEAYEAGGGDIDDFLLDGVHPNADGHRMAAEALMDIIAPASPAPVVAAEEADQITTVSATLNASVTSTGASETAVSVYWGPSDAGESETGWAHSASLGPAFGPPPLPVSHAVAGLLAYSEHVFRFRAANNDGIAWTGPATFTTQNDRSPGHGFCPTNVSGLALWLDGVDIDGDGAEDQLAEGTPVSTWSDKSGRGLDAIAVSANPADQPVATRQTGSQFSSRQTVRFRGVTTGHLESGTTSSYNFLHNGTGTSVFLVHRVAHDAGDIALLLDTGMTSGSNVGYSFALDRRHHPDALYFVIKDAINTYQQAAYSGLLPRGQAQLVAQRYAYTGGTNMVRLSTDGVDVPTSAGLLAGPPSTSDATRVLRLGVSAGSAPFRGEIAEALIYDRLLDPQEVDQVGNYLTEKYGLSTTWLTDTDEDGTADVRDADDDNDDIPDAWENKHLLDRLDASDRDIHADTDRHTNYQEYVADTDPHDGDSFFSITVEAGSTGGTRLRFLSSLGRSYGIDFRIGLDDRDWSSLTNNLPGSGGWLAIEHAPDTETGYYRGGVSR